jgi:SWI/SNF-related matrix-associated actin-dependent regulator of chromatin subfamily A member 5
VSISDRAHRIGQKKEVQVFRLVTEHTIEEKIVERAQQKLKLDAMVVQQGRLQGKEKMSRDSLLDAVRFGADKIFKSKESSITDDDIDLILNIGKQRTEQLNEKLQEADKGNMLDFKLDGGVTGTQTFEGIDYSKMGQTQSEIFGILDLGKRERRQVAYNEDHSYRQMSAPKREKAKEPKLPKFLRLPRMEEWQMFDRDDLEALQEVEEQAFKSLPEEKQKLPVTAWAGAILKRAKKILKGEGEEEPPDTDSADADDAPILLSDEQEQQKQNLLAEGFPDWERRHYVAFVRACAKYGRTKYTEIAEEVGKPQVLVKAYSEAFWDRNVGKKRFSDHEYERVVKTIERGEKKLEDAQNLERCTATLISLFDNPWTDLEIHHTQFKDKAYSAQEDRYLLCYTHKFGYGQWEAIKMNIRRSPTFRFDYFIRSLPVEAIGKRCDQLMRAAEREVEHLERAAREDAGLRTEPEKDEEGNIIPLPPMKLPMYKEIQAKKRIVADEEYADKLNELEGNVESVENEIGQLQKRLRELERDSQDFTPAQKSFNSMEVPEDLVPELINLVAQSGPASINTLASEFTANHPGKMTKKQVFIKIEEVAVKEKREDEGDTKVVWHIRDECIHLLDVGTLRYLRKEKQKRMDSSQNRRHKTRSARQRPKEEETIIEEEVEGPPLTFPDYDLSEPPKDAKKMFTHFCIQSRRDVKASLHPEERKDKVRTVV